MSTHSRIFLKTILLLFCIKAGVDLHAQEAYPYPVKYITLNIEQQTVKMAYMDVMPTSPPAHTIILLHGKNFNGYYWKDVAAFLLRKGYRVIIPDQVGWGKSDKPDIHYSFHQLAANNRALLDSLHVTKLTVLGHSMGGMLATRFTLMYPEMVEKLILEDPIGLEDYRTFVPYTPVEKLYQTELAATYDSYKKYMEGYFPKWKPEYDELVKQQASALSDPNFKQIAMANALTYQMIYEQPVCYEFKNIKAKTLLIVGHADRTVVGKDKLSKDAQKQHGQYPQLGQAIQLQMKNCQRIDVVDVGHIPHIQQPDKFKQYISSFLDIAVDY